MPDQQHDGTRSGKSVKSTQNTRRLARRGKNVEFQVSPYVVFSIFAACHSIAAIYAPIQDCDEVFNYWEPTHYLTDDHGLQTWEYAPQYAIRSWAYAGLHAAVIQLGRQLLPLTGTAVAFYWLRMILGLACAACETKLYATIARTMNERVAILFAFIISTAPGMWHASIAYLPSSFAMYTAMLGASAFMDWQPDLKTSKGILWFGIGACLGWPFAAALSLPFLLEELVLAWLSDRKGQLQFFWRVSDGAVKSLMILAMQMLIDSLFYRKLTMVPLNIVLYNVFSSKGPDLYGTEPWHFYVRNLALNFHIWLPLALLAMPLFLLQAVTAPGGERLTSWRPLSILASTYVWLTIFTLQPHKEERFMYPAYPFIALNAAFAFHLLLIAFGTVRQDSIVAKIPILIRVLSILAVVFIAMVISLLRIAGTWTAFSAPLSIYSSLSTIDTPTANLCLGKEWYRFPSHYLLPDSVHVKFIRSEFRGLLPGEFSVGARNDGLFSATWAVPAGMNDDNLEDIGKYTELASCDYLVDSSAPSTSITSYEPDFVHNDGEWERLTCLPFLDAVSTPVLGRLFWIPDLPILPKSLQRVWGEYCLLRRKV